MAHPIVHVELSAKDHQEAGRWYAELFGWEIKEWPDMDYTSFQTSENSVGGGFSTVREDAPAGTVLVYIQVDDLAGHLARVAARGGTVVMERLDVPGVGAMGYFRDPTGNLMALLQPAME